MTLSRRLPLLRMSVLRTALGLKTFNKTGQLGDGREAAAADYVERHARAGDIASVLATIDRYAVEESFLVNVGEEKGALLDAAVLRAEATRVLELGTYCGYSALRIARTAPAAQIFSVELSSANAEVARRIWKHAGAADRITCVVGTIGDGGATLDSLSRTHGFVEESLDFLFIDHHKNSYLPDLLSIVDRGWLRRGSIVLADNIGIPGSPKYRAYMQEQQGRDWITNEHQTHVEYLPLLRDVMLESEYMVSRS